MLLLSNCGYVGDVALAWILPKVHKSVKVVDIRGCGIDANSFGDDIEMCSELVDFSADDCSSECFVKIVRGCTKLRRIRLVTATSLTDESITSLADCCPDLEFLNVPHCAEVAIDRLAQCSKMKRINVNYCDNISDDAIVSLARAWPLLTVISLISTSITDASISALCQHCPLLTSLSFADCANITDTTIIAVAEKLPAIQYAWFSGCPAITSSAVELLPGNFLPLDNQSCNFQNCRKLY
jgi:hypothetical protein